jgi:hypothetical protein
VERVLSIAKAAITGDGVEQCSAFVGIASGTTECEVQPVGVAGLAKNASTSSTIGNDACGVYGVGRITAGGTGVGLGGFFVGRRDSSSGSATGVEVVCNNSSAQTGSYDPVGFTRTLAAWIHAGGTADSGAGVQFGNPFGRKFKVGIGFNSQNGGAVSDATIRDDSSSATVLDVRGSHVDAVDTSSAALTGAALKTGPSYIEVSVMADPPAPPPNGARIFLRSVAGSLQLAARFPDGEIEVIASQP